MTTVPAASIADSKIAAVFEAMSQLLRARDKGEPVSHNTWRGTHKVNELLDSHERNALLDQATSTLHECGIKVDTSETELKFRFDHCEGFTGAWRRIKAVQSHFEAGSKLKAASFFVSDIRLLMDDPPNDPIEDGVWEVANDSVYYKPRYFSQFSLRAGDTEKSKDFKGSRNVPIGWNAVMTYHLSVGIHLEPDNDIGTSKGLALGTYILNPPTGNKVTDKEVAKLGPEWMQFMTSGLLQGFMTAVQGGSVSGACRILDSVMCDGSRKLRDGWAKKGWTVEEAGIITVPAVLSPDWGVKHSQQYADKRAVPDLVVGMSKKTDDPSLSKETE